MNCRDWEERIALYAEGDLPRPDAAEAEQHLAGCASCAEFAQGVKQSLAVLRAAHEQPIENAHFAAVRARVLQQIQNRRRRWRLAWAGALAMSAGATLFLMLAPRPVDPPHVALVHPPALQGALPEPAPPAPRVRPVRRKAKPPRPPEPLMVKLITDDPDVVIYWIAN